MNLEESGSGASTVRHIWIYDGNRRIYTDPETGEKSPNPIYKYSWIKHEVVGETSRSWLVGNGWEPIKVPKKGPYSGVAFSENEVAQFCYVHENAHKLSEQVRLASYEQLKEIERILSLPSGSDDRQLPAASRPETKSDENSG